jgi:hypothetical protein
LGDPVNLRDPGGLQAQDPEGGPDYQPVGVFGGGRPGGTPQPQNGGLQEYCDEHPELCQRELRPGQLSLKDVPGADDAVSRLTNPDCAKALGGTVMYAENALFKTSYFVQDGGVITAPTAADPYSYDVASTRGYTVTLNVNTFFVPTNAPVAYGDGTTGIKNLVSAFATQTGLDPSKFTETDFQAAFLLHELGHTLTTFKDDSSNPGLSRAYDQVVADNCFKDKK